MENTIGQRLGVQRHTLSIKNDAGDKASISVRIDYTSASDNDIAGWLNSNRVISGQRVWRKMDVDEIGELDGQTFIANNIGQKIKTMAERKREARATLDALKAAHPDEFAAMMENYNDQD